MPNRQPIETTSLDTIYRSQTIPWSRPRDLLVVGRARLREIIVLPRHRSARRRAHAAGIGAAWYEGDLYVRCGPKTPKARNLAANPACTISASLPGTELVFEGEARRVADTPTLEAVAALYRERGWPVQVDGDAFTAPYSALSSGLADEQDQAPPPGEGIVETPAQLDQLFVPASSAAASSARSLLP